MLLALAGAVTALGAGPALANNYSECMKLVEMAPKRAYDLAGQWRDYGGGLPAEHCMALAQFELGQYEAAANAFEDLAQRAKRQANEPPAPDPAEEGVTAAEPPPPPLPKTMSVDLLSQAGNAWLMAEENEKAFTILSQALGDPNTTNEQAVEILVDRARARVEMDNLEGAVKDLDVALQRAGPRADILAYRAAAHRALSAFASARADLDKALELEPTNVEALLERGNLNHAIGNEQAAVVDWIQVTKLSPDTLAGKAAEDSIAKVRQQEAEAEAAAAQDKTGEASGSTQPGPEDPSQPADASGEGR
jgi:tetratricopeptide (TPR) repeat protein